MRAKNKRSPRQSGTNCSSVRETGSQPLLVTSKTAATMLGIGERTLWRYTKCNAIPCYRVGKAVRYSPGHLQAWIRLGCPTEPGSGDLVRKAVNQ